MTAADACVVVVGAGYEGKRPYYERLAQLGAQLVIVDEPGHWSRSLVDDGVAVDWVPSVITGDADVDAQSILAAMEQAQVRPDGVLTFFENSVRETARVAVALGLPGNPPEAVDAARSKLRTRERSADLGLPTPRARRVRSLDELFAAAAELGFPTVVKPEFGADSFGCVRVDDFDSLPGVFRIVRDIVSPEYDSIFRAGLDLLLEDYLDGVEFDVDLVMQDGECAFSSVSQNWPTAEPSFQETGLHCPPDHDRRAVRRLVELCVGTVQAFRLGTGVLHVEGKCTSRGPRIVEINARMGGTRIHQVVETVWGVDLIEAQLHSCLGLPQELKPSRKPRCAVVNAIVHAPATGRLARLPLAEIAGEPGSDVDLDVFAEPGQEVVGPEGTFATELAELMLIAKDLRHARSRLKRLLSEPPTVLP